MKTCTCKEMTCNKDCTKNHTHKGFFCEVCIPKTNEREWEKEFDDRFVKPRIIHPDIFPKLESIETSSEIKAFIRQLELDTIAKRDEQIKNRIENVFASKHEGLERINIKHEYAVMSCFDDRNYEAVTSLNKPI